MTWGAVNGATKYLLERRVYKDGAWSSWATLSTKLTGTSYTDTNVTAGRKYQYRVYAYNGNWGDYVKSSAIVAK